MVLGGVVLASESLARLVAEFLADGLTDGTPGIVVADLPLEPLHGWEQVLGF